MEDNNIFFVELKEPDEIKRSFLECLKSIVENLERFEKFKISRKKKIIKINKLKSIAKEIGMSASNLKKNFPESNLNKLGITVKEFDKMVSNLKSELPESHIRKIKNKEKTKKKKTQIIASKSESERKPTSEIEKLESELSAIEDKLKGLQ